MTIEADRFWQQTEAALSETPLDLVIDRDDFYSQPDWDVFQMRYTSSGGYRPVSYTHLTLPTIYSV